MIRSTRGRGRLGDYAVGYGRPPKSTRFQPGVSGNPSGHRKGTKRIGTLLAEALLSKITIRENGRTRQITVQEDIIRGLVNDARKDTRALRLLLSLLERYQEHPGAPDPTVLQREDQDIIRRYLARRVAQTSQHQPDAPGSIATEVPDEPTKPDPQ